MKNCVFTTFLAICAFPILAIAADCSTRWGFVPATDDVPAYHTMVSPKSSRMSRAYGSVSSTCLHGKSGKLTYHRLYRTYECAPLRPITKEIADLLRNTEKVGQPCVKEWEDVATFHYLLY